MKLWNQLTAVLVLVVALTATISNAQELTPGVVRISDQDVVGNHMKLQSYTIRSEAGCTEDAGCCTEESECCDDWEECDDCDRCRFFCLNRLFHKDCDNCDNCDRCRNQGKCRFCKGLCKAKNRYGYFHPAQTPPFGCYKIAYPVNPAYFDQRDGSLYAAQGYGVNISVPLAPNVGAAYNYGWGIPSSRLTPISNHLPAPAMPQTVYPPRTRVYPPMIHRVPPSP